MNYNEIAYTGKLSEIFGELKFLCFHLHIINLGKVVISHDDITSS